MYTLISYSVSIFLHVLLYLLEKRNQTRRDPAPPPALGGDIDTRNRPVRTSISLGEYFLLIIFYFINNNVSLTFTRVSLKVNLYTT